MQQPAHKEKPAKKAATGNASPQHAPAGPGTLDVRPHDLRSTLEWLRAQGDLIETEKTVDPDLEVTGTKVGGDLTTSGFFDVEADAGVGGLELGDVGR